MAKPIVYGTPLSTYVRTTRMALMEKGVDYDLVDVGVLDAECKGPEHCTLFQATWMGRNLTLIRKN